MQKPANQDEWAAASVIRMRYSAGIIGLTAVVLSAVGTSSENGPIRSAVAEGQEPEYAEIMGPISAPIAEVWKAFTTSDGLSSFYAPGAFVEPKVGGLFELYLFPDNPVGQRGLEGLRILAFEPERRLMIAWKAPAYVREEIGSQHTIQEISFTASGPEETIVRIRQFGFGDTAAWAGAKRYFELRGRDVHMNLKERFDHGSLDWEEAMERFWRTSELIDNDRDDE
jgi:uncharacterized protein YndB with AHSA1/START domain